MALGWIYYGRAAFDEFHDQANFVESLGTFKVYFFCLVEKCGIWLILPEWQVGKERPNGGLCQLCKRAPETAAHILFKCRYTKKRVHQTKDWLGWEDLDTANWKHFDSVHSSWTETLNLDGRLNKATASHPMLVTWEFGMRGMREVCRSHATLQVSSGDGGSHLRQLLRYCHGKIFGGNHSGRTVPLFLRLQPCMTYASPFFA